MRARLRWGTALAAAIAAGGSACSAQSNALEPKGRGATEIAGLWWPMFAMAVAVTVLVFGLLAWGWTRRGRSQLGEPGEMDPRKDSDRRWGIPLVVWGGVIMPIIVLAALMALNLRTLSRLVSWMNDETPRVERIQIVGHKWWWEIRYPDHGFTTANEFHIPVGRPVDLELTTADVIHSVWIPELQGKLDLIPGRTNVLRIDADRPGRFRGYCAEFCGKQHARMGLVVFAHDDEGYAEFIDRHQQPAFEPSDDVALRGREIFMTNTCIQCHTIRGTPADGTLGPDLTHLMTRATLAAGQIPNTRAWRGGWIADPDAIKPGALMPPATLSGEDFRALLAYLETLR